MLSLAHCWITSICFLANVIPFWIRSGLIAKLAFLVCLTFMKSINCLVAMPFSQTTSNNEKLALAVCDPSYELYAHNSGIIFVGCVVSLVPCFISYPKSVNL